MIKPLVFLLFSLSLICFSINGQNLKDKQGKRTGKWIIYKSKSSKDLKIEEGVFVNGRKEGQWINYFEDGKATKLKGSYSNNRPDGEFIRYYKNGKIKEKGSYLKGQSPDVRRFVRKRKEQTISKYRVQPQKRVA